MKNRAKVALIMGGRSAIALCWQRMVREIAIVDLKKEKMDAVAKEVQDLGRLSARWEPKTAWWPVSS